jgi:hypothetical protein
MALTSEEEQAYLDNGGNKCPKCGSDDISGGHFESDSNEAWREVTCENPKCEFVWFDNYKMTGISEKS